MTDTDAITRADVVALRRSLARLEAQLGMSPEPLAGIQQGFRLVNPGDIVQADDHNLVMSQAVAVFANAAARDAAITAPIAGMVCYLADLKQTQQYVAGIWQPIAGNVPNAWLQWVGTQLIGSGTQKLDGFTPAGPFIGGGATNVGTSVRFPTSGAAQFLGVIDCQAAATTDFIVGVGTVAAKLLDGSGASSVAATKRARLQVSQILNVTAGTSYCLWSTASANYDVKEVMLAARFLGPI